MTIFSDDVLMLNAAEMEEWYERELIMRAEQELRSKRIHGGGSLPQTLAQMVGLIPAKYNMVFTPTPVSGTLLPSMTLTGGPQQPAWYTFHTTINSNAAFAPDGSFTVPRITEDTTNNQHYIAVYDSNQSGGAILANVANIQWRVAAIARAAERGRICLGMTGGFAKPFVTCCFDLLNGVTGFSNVAGTNWTVLNTSIKFLGSGYYLCIMDVSNSDTTLQAPQANYFLDNGVGSAAQNISYTGSTANGVYIWWTSLAPTGMWKIGRQVFFDGFDTLNTIDLYDTRGPNYNWYVHNLFPNCILTNFGLVTNPPSAPTPPQALTVSNSILTIDNTAAGAAGTGFTSQIWTVAYTGGVGFIGKVFGPPAVFAASMAWDNDLATTNAAFGVPAFWGLTIEGLTGTTPTHMIELDHMEGAGPLGGGAHNATATIHDWHAPTTQDGQVGISGYPLDYARIGGGGSADDPTIRAILLRQNEFASIWIDKNSNDGTNGLIASAFNGVIRGVGIVYSAASGVPAGIYNALDSQHLPIFFNTSDGGAGGSHVTPIHIDYATVYTP